MPSSLAFFRQFWDTCCYSGFSGSCARFCKVGKTLLCYSPFGGSWMGSPGADVHDMSFYHLGQCVSCPALLGLLAACALVITAPPELNISVSGCAGICLCNFFSVLQGGGRVFCPSAGQDAAGVGNAGPNPRHQTLALGWQAGPVCSLTHGSSTLLHQLFRSVGILCIFFFINTCDPRTWEAEAG